MRSGNEGSGRGTRIPEKREKKRRKPVKVTVSPFAVLPLLTLVFFGDPAVVPAAFAAAFLHECGHLAALRALNGSVEGIAVLPFGVEIERGGGILSYPGEILLSFSGPAVNLLLAPLAFSSNEFLRLFGFSCAALGCFNLLPIKGLDGGDVLRNLLCLFFDPDRIEGFLTVVSAFGICALLLFGFYLSLGGLFAPCVFIPVLYLFFAAFSGTRKKRDGKT